MTPLASHTIADGNISWCVKRGQNPICACIKHVLDVLQLKSEVPAMNTMKGYVTAISHRHVLVQGAPLSLDPSMKKWIKGLKHSKGIPCMIMPAWCLESVLAALIRVPFEPIGTCCFECLTLKTAFLLAVTSGRRASEMHAFCCKPLYIWFANAGVTLFTRLGFLPKVCNKANVSLPIFVPAMHNQIDVALCKLCVHRVLNEYVRHTSNFRHDGTAQLFVTYGGQVKGKAISKPRFSKW